MGEESQVRGSARGNPAPVFKRHYFQSKMRKLKVCKPNGPQRSSHAFSSAVQPAVSAQALGVLKQTAEELAAIFLHRDEYFNMFNAPKWRLGLCWKR